jgi:hypothetical protein
MLVASPPQRRLGHGLGDSKGQQRLQADSRDLALTSANAQDQTHWLGHAMQGVRVGLPRFDGQGGWLGQATFWMTSLSVAVSNSSGVR